LGEGTLENSDLAEATNNGWLGTGAPVKKFQHTMHACHVAAPSIAMPSDNILVWPGPKSFVMPGESREHLERDVLAKMKRRVV
jgi:hypothetical protein